MNLQDYNWMAMLPEIIILATTILLLLLDLFVKVENKKSFLWVGLVGIVLGFVFLITQWNADTVNILNQTFRLDAFAKGFKALLLIAAAIVYLIMLDSKQEHMERGATESFYLMLSALLGAMIMTSSADLITLFVGIELLSISSYIMVGMNKSSTVSNEAAFKYVVNGGVSTAITLFGMSYLYGLTGYTNLYKIATELSTGVASQNSFLLIITFMIIFVGISFKIAVTPFQMWVPDVYQGAPTSVTAFLSVISKTAGFVVVLRLFIIGFMHTTVAPAGGGVAESIFYSVRPYLIVIAVITMILGNTAALKQKNIKRLFAYSSIAQAGYLMLPFISLTAYTFDNMWFYLTAYLFMNLGAFAVIQFVTQLKGSEEIASFRGLFKSQPWVAVAMTIFLVSLAGIPATAGFIGKFNIFFEAIGAKQLVLASIMIATTVVSYFYYFFIIDEMFFKREKSVEKTGVRVPVATMVVLALCSAATILLGVFPEIGYTIIHHLDLSTFFKA